MKKLALLLILFCFSSSKPQANESTKIVTDTIKAPPTETIKIYVPPMPESKKTEFTQIIKAESEQIVDKTQELQKKVNQKVKEEKIKQEVNEIFNKWPLTGNKTD